MHIVGDFNAAKLAVDNDNSCLKVVTHNTHIALPACYLGNISHAVSVVLDGLLEQYSNEFQGVPVAFNSRNVKLLTPLGNFVGQQSKTHMDFEVEFIIFQPKMGDFVQGVINQINERSFGALIHGFFYVCVNYDRRYHRPNSFRVGDMVIVQVSKLEEDGHGYLSIIATYGRNLSSCELNDSGIDDDTRSVYSEVDDHLLQPTSLADDTPTSDPLLPHSISPMVLSPSALPGSVLSPPSQEPVHSVPPSGSSLELSPTKRKRKKEKKKKEKKEAKHRKETDKHQSVLSAGDKDVALEGIVVKEERVDGVLPVFPGATVEPNVNVTTFQLGPAHMAPNPMLPHLDGVEMLQHQDKLPSQEPVPSAPPSSSISNLELLSAKQRQKKEKKKKEKKEKAQEGVFVEEGITGDVVPVFPGSTVDPNVTSTPTLGLLSPLPMSSILSPTAMPASLLLSSQPSQEPVLSVTPPSVSSMELSPTKHKKKKEKKKKKKKEKAREEVFVKEERMGDVLPVFPESTVDPDVMCAPTVGLLSPLSMSSIISPPAMPASMLLSPQPSQEPVLSVPPPPSSVSSMRLLSTKHKRKKDKKKKERKQKKHKKKHKKETHKHQSFLLTGHKDEAPEGIVVKTERADGMLPVFPGATVEHNGFNVTSFQLGPAHMAPNPKLP